MKVVKEILLTEEERDILKKASEILDFISERVGGDNGDDSFFSYRNPKELEDILSFAHAPCFEEY